MSTPIETSQSSHDEKPSDTVTNVNEDDSNTAKSNEPNIENTQLAQSNVTLSLQVESVPVISENKSKRKLSTEPSPLDAQNTDDSNVQHSSGESSPEIIVRPPRKMARIAKDNDSNTPQSSCESSPEIKNSRRFRRVRFVKNSSDSSTDQESNGLTDSSTPTKSDSLEEDASRSLQKMSNNSLISTSNGFENAASSKNRKQKQKLRRQKRRKLRRKMANQRILNSTLSTNNSNTSSPNSTLMSSSSTPNSTSPSTSNSEISCTLSDSSSSSPQLRTLKAMPEPVSVFASITGSIHARISCTYLEQIGVHGSMTAQVESFYNQMRHLVKTNASVRDAWLGIALNIKLPYLEKQSEWSHQQVNHEHYQGPMQPLINAARLGPPPNNESSSQLNALSMQFELPLYEYSSQSCSLLHLPPEVKDLSQPVSKAQRSSTQDSSLSCDKKSDSFLLIKLYSHHEMIKNSVPGKVHAQFAAYFLNQIGLHASVTDRNHGFYFTLRQLAKLVPQVCDAICAMLNNVSLPVVEQYETHSDTDYANCRPLREQTNKMLNIKKNGSVDTVDSPSYPTNLIIVDTSTDDSTTELDASCQNNPSLNHHHQQDSATASAEYAKTVAGILAKIGATASVTTETGAFYEEFIRQAQFEQVRDALLGVLHGISLPLVDKSGLPEKSSDPGQSNSPERPMLPLLQLAVEHQADLVAKQREQMAADEALVFATNSLNFYTDSEK